MNDATPKLWAQNGSDQTPDQKRQLHHVVKHQASRQLGQRNTILQHRHSYTTTSST